LLGEGPPPFALQRYLLAAGNGTVSGLGAAAIYGKLPLSFRVFQEAWTMQQLVTRMNNDQAREDARQELIWRRTLKLEATGVLDRPYQPPGVPDGLPYDPGA
jgi:hypothetical protein